jgi:hypothetical protein
LRSFELHMVLVKRTPATWCAKCAYLFPGVPTVHFEPPCFCVLGVSRAFDAE